jgi:hypothetical protein
MLVKNVSGADLDLRVPGLEAFVEAGATIDVPEFQPDGESPIIYSPDIWQPVKAPSKSSGKDAS